jgi:hypothetical protein
MPGKYPFDYELTPQDVGEGTHTVEVELQNVGTGDVENLDVRLNSLDDYGIHIDESSKSIDEIALDETTTIPFEIEIRRRGAVYISVDGWVDDSLIHWESPDIPLTTGMEIAEIANFVARTEGYPAMRKPLTCEVTVESLKASDNLVLEFWVKAPDGELMSIDKMGTGTMAAGEVEDFSVEFTPEQEGIYTFHAYLFEKTQRLDYARDHLNVAS